MLLRRSSADLNRKAMCRLTCLAESSAANAAVAALAARGDKMAEKESCHMSRTTPIACMITKT